jgi:hypothetical protein
MDDSLEFSARKFPALSKELVEFLDRQIPPRCPEPGDSEREIWIYCGKRRLVELLKSRFEAQISESIR